MAQRRTVCISLALATYLMPTRDDLDTPALCLDLDAFDENVRDAVTLCRLQNIDWRPHAKCHKSIDVGRKLIAAGAIGLTCAKLGEAEVFAQGIQERPVRRRCHRRCLAIDCEEILLRHRAPAIAARAAAC